MLDWLLKNKEWLFSGVGVAIAAAIVSIGRFLLSRRHSERKNRGTAPSRSSSVLNENLRDILSDIRACPPYQRDERQGHYLGARIRFVGSFVSLVKVSSQTVQVSLRSDERFGPGLVQSEWVVFETSVNNWPELKFIRQDAQVIVEGAVDGLDTALRRATLKNVRLEFPADTPAPA